VPDVHYQTVTPTFLWRLGRRWGTLVDAESNTNWELDGQTSFKAALLLGWMLTTRLALRSRRRCRSEETCCSTGA